MTGEPLLSMGRGGSSSLAPCTMPEAPLRFLIVLTYQMHDHLFYFFGMAFYGSRWWADVGGLDKEGQGWWLGCDTDLCLLERPWTISWEGISCIINRFHGFCMLFSQFSQLGIRDFGVCSSIISREGLISCGLWRLCTRLACMFIFVLDLMLARNGILGSSRSLVIKLLWSLSIQVCSSAILWLLEDFQCGSSMFQASALEQITNLSR